MSCCLGAVLHAYCHAYSCRSNAKHWVYPATVNERAYQVDIIQTALLQNTLVCLPTGLGKTLIAAVVMYNFTRWFPEVSAGASQRKKQPLWGNPFGSRHKT